jgi:uncharacterized protein YbjT (DUF2867 family)
MRILVIGGTGFIGSRVAARLMGQGHEVLVGSPTTGVNSITGKGLQRALAGTDVVIDVSNSPSYDEHAVMDFFRISTTNLLAAEKIAGVKHHVMLSIVGTENLQGNAYFKAKMQQEELIRKSAERYTVVRATQFMEFLGAVADLGDVDGVTHVSTGAVQLIAADDVVEKLCEIATGRALNSAIEIAGPRKARMSDMVEKYLRARGDARVVVADPDALYFGSLLREDTMVPTSTAMLGGITFDHWLEDRAQS